MITIAITLLAAIFGFRVGVWFAFSDEKDQYLKNYLSTWKFDYFSFHERNIIDSQYVQRAKIFLDFYKAKKPMWGLVDPIELHRRFKQEGLWSPWDIYQDDPCDIWKSMRLREAVPIDEKP